jgi:hypothetical protein
MEIVPPLRNNPHRPDSLPEDPANDKGFGRENMAQPLPQGCR